MNILKAILNKGGAGKSVTRDETAERLSGLMRRYNEIMYAYDAAAGMSSDPVADSLEAFGRVVRDDIGKLSELILSAGGVPPSGTDIEPGDIAPGTSEAEAVRRLTDLERNFEAALRAESRVKHQFRTSAMIENTLARTQERLSGLQKLTTGVAVNP